MYVCMRILQLTYRKLAQRRRLLEESCLQVGSTNKEQEKNVFPSFPGTCVGLSNLLDILVYFPVNVNMLIAIT